MQEEELYQYWHYYALSGSEVLLSGGHRLRIIHEGELNRQQGPDIRSAKFELDGVIYQGEVEFHLTFSDWYAHGHHLDRAYADVLLHLIASGEPRSVVHRAGNLIIPTYRLPAPKQLSFKRHPALSCFEGEKPVSQIKDVLASMALKRLDSKINAFRAQLEHRPAEIIFYESVLDMLGLPNNRLPFRLLARKLTLVFFRQLAAQLRGDSFLLPALYFGQAGFLEQSEPDGYTRLLMKEYRQYRYLLPEVPVAASGWNMHLVRFHNHPHFRLAGWVYLMLHYYPQSVFEVIYELFRAREDYEAVKIRLKKIFDLEVENYWQEHFALNKPLKNRRNLHYWGESRLTEILINVILPLLTAAAEREGSYGFAEYLRQFFLTVSARLAYGRIARNMPWYIHYSGQIPQPALLQAMLYLDMNYCRDYRCAECPLGRRQ